MRKKYGVKKNQFGDIVENVLMFLTIVGEENQSKEVH
jgi:hypothetical protein